MMVTLLSGLCTVYQISKIWTDSPGFCKGYFPDSEEILSLATNNGDIKVSQKEVHKYFEEVLYYETKISCNFHLSLHIT